MIDPLGVPAPPVQILDVSGPLEVFSRAPGYEVQLGNPGQDRCPPTSRRVSLAGATPIEEIDGPIDTLIITGGPGAETSVYDESFVSWIAATAGQSRRVASICTGAFSLGAAGLLDDKEAVTHWAYCNRLAKEFPRLKVRPEPIYLVYTSAGITAGIDLCLALHPNPEIVTSPSWGLLPLVALNCGSLRTHSLTHDQRIGPVTP